MSPYSAPDIARSSPYSSSSRVEVRSFVQSVPKRRWWPSMSVVSTSRKSLPRSSAAAGGGGSTSSAPAERHASSARSKPSSTSGSVSTSASRGERAMRAPLSAAPSPRSPVSTSSAIAQSPSVRAIGPGWSRLPLSGKTPRSGSAPRVGLIVDVPDSADGIRSEPAVSVPVASGTIPAASAAAEPPLSRRACGRARAGCRPGRSSRPRRTRACGGVRPAPRPPP